MMASPPPENPGETIPVVASSDENYALQMGVMFVSLLENTAHPERCHLFVINGSIRPETQEMIKAEVGKTIYKKK